MVENSAIYNGFSATDINTKKDRYVTYLQKLLTMPSLITQQEINLLELDSSNLTGSLNDVINNLKDFDAATDVISGFDFNASGTGDGKDITVLNNLLSGKYLSINSHNFELTTILESNPLIDDEYIVEAFRGQLSKDQIKILELLGSESFQFYNDPAANDAFKTILLNQFFEIDATKLAEATALFNGEDSATSLADATDLAKSIKDFVGYEISADSEYSELYNQQLEKLFNTKIFDNRINGAGGNRGGGGSSSGSAPARRRPGRPSSGGGNNTPPTQELTGLAKVFNSPIAGMNDLKSRLEFFGKIKNGNSPADNLVNDVVESQFLHDNAATLTAMAAEIQAKIDELNAQRPTTGGGSGSAPTRRRPSSPSPTIQRLLQQKTAIENRATEVEGMISFNQNGVIDSPAEASQEQLYEVHHSISDYRKKMDEIDEWLATVDHSTVTDAEVKAKEVEKARMAKAYRFYKEEQVFQERIQAQLTSGTLTNFQKDKLTELLQTLDESRASYTEHLTDPSKKGVSYGTAGYLEELKLNKTKDLIEKVLLEGGNQADFDRYSGVCDDEIEAYQNLLTAKESGDTRVANRLADFWDLIVGKTYEAKTYFLDIIQKNEAGLSQAELDSKLKFFDQQYARLMGSAKDELLAKVNDGKSVSEALKGSDFEATIKGIVDVGLGLRTIEEIHREQAVAFTDADRNGSVSDLEASEILLAAKRAKELYEQNQSSLNQANFIPIEYDTRFDYDHDGDIDDTDINFFTNIIAESFAGANQIAAAITAIDTDGNSQLSAAESKAALDKFRVAVANSNKNQLTQADRAFDLDGNGKVDNNDFRIMAKVIASDSEAVYSDDSFMDVALGNIQYGMQRYQANVDITNGYEDAFNDSEGDLKARSFNSVGMGRSEIGESSAQYWLNYNINTLWNVTMRPTLGNNDPRILELFADKQTEIQELSDEYSQKLSDPKVGYWTGYRPVGLALQEASVVSFVISKGANYETATNLMNVFDALQEFDADRTSFRDGVNLDISKYVEGTGPLNPKKDKNAGLADVSAQHFDAMVQLKDLFTAQYNKMNPNLQGIFGQGMTEINSIHDQIKTLMLAGKSATSKEVADLNEKFNAKVELLKGICTGDKAITEAVEAIDANGDFTFTLGEITNARNTFIDIFKGTNTVDRERFDFDKNGVVDAADYDILQSIIGIEKGTIIGSVLTEADRTHEKVAYYNDRVRVAGISQADLAKANACLTFFTDEKAFDAAYVAKIKTMNLDDTKAAEFRNLYNQLRDLRSAIESQYLAGTDPSAKIAQLDALKTAIAAIA